MDGVHDLGGMHFGPIDRDPDERGFHERWEAVVVAMQNAVMRGAMNIDEFRHGIERMEPSRYLGVTYFEKWLDGISRVLVEKGIVTADALDTRTRFFEDRPDAPATAALTTPLPAATKRPPPEMSFVRLPAVPPRFRVGRLALSRQLGGRLEELGRPPPEMSFVRLPAVPPRFRVGDRIVTKQAHPAGHTRLPRYARGKRGEIAQHYGTQVFPDTHAHGLGESPQPLYRVAFDARELWGESAEPNTTVTLDLWESYLLPA